MHARVVDFPLPAGPVTSTIPLEKSAKRMIFAGFGCGLTAMNKKMDQEEMQTLQNAITRSVTTCYTLEGSYPQSLGYLKKHYGLHYDENKYFVDYQPLGANIMPDITIIRKEADHR